MARQDINWRATMKSARFAIFDAKAAFPVLIFLLHISYDTFYLLLGSLIFFYILERNGYDFNASLRRMRIIIYRKGCAFFRFLFNLITLEPLFPERDRKDYIIRKDRSKIRPANNYFKIRKYRY